MFGSRTKDKPDLIKNNVMHTSVALLSCKNNDLMSAVQPRSRTRVRNAAIVCVNPRVFVLWMGTQRRAVKLSLMVHGDFATFSDHALRI